MIYIEAQDVVRRINCAVSQKQPFLFAIDYEKRSGLFVENPLDQQSILFRTPIGRNDQQLRPDTKPQITQIRAESFDRYKSRFDTIQSGLNRGDSFLANLTICTPIEVSGSLRDIFLVGGSPYGLCVEGEFVCFSPERFVRICDGAISTNPMKGTISSSTPRAEQIILSDTKETAEHNTIVDLMRNDLGIIAREVDVTRFRYLDHLHTTCGGIIQVSSEIVGAIDGNIPPGDAIWAMLPAGSISGAPKRSTVNLIAEAEGKPRGFYTGIMGYFDGAEMDTAVMIRFIEQRPTGERYFRSGGGITVNSDPLSEYNEVISKIYLPR